MTKTHTPKISDVKNFRTLFLAGNTIVATRNQMKVKFAGEDYWYAIPTEDVLHHIGDVSSMDFYTHDGLTPEGEKLKAEYDAKQAEDNEDDD